jgi:hypothetical protein
MNTQEEETIIPSTQLARIYKTDPFGFPLYPYDEELYKQSKQGKGLDPDAISEVVKTGTEESAGS